MARTRTPVGVRLARKTRVEEDGCVVFTGYLDKQGYGRIYVDTEKELVHRVAHKLYVGPIADGLQVDHLCGNRACVNPAHLEAVTPWVNTMRSQSPSAINAAKETCLRGHPLDAANTRLVARRRQRQCRACDAIRAKAYRERRAAA